jgi:hypothetical protein
MAQMPTDDDKPSRDWLDIGPPPIGHNRPPADIERTTGPCNAEDVAALVRHYMGAVHDLAHRYKASPAWQTNDGLLTSTIQTLGATMELLNSLGADGDHLSILQRLSVDLKEVGAGRHIRWLEPMAKRGGVAGVPEDVAVLRAGYAAAVEALFQGRYGRRFLVRDAAQYVEKRIPAQSRAFDGPKPSGPKSVNKRPRWHAVRDWYYQCSGSGDGTDDGMRDLYRQMLAREDDQPGTLMAFLEHPHDSFLRHPAD